MMHRARISSSLILHRNFSGRSTDRALIRRLTTQNLTATPENPVAIVTGASRGIGKAIACALADAGCKVVVNYAVNEKLALEVVEELNSRCAVKGGSAIAIQANVASDVEVKAMFKQTIAKVSSDVQYHNEDESKNIANVYILPSVW